eukprot:TRINITY_DN4043_c0_g1_i1.p1 TRINITY_DN4043_c0_g1~~TRINITY_DN4043_c0_g1_i1.p1  ORF type:complete len:127 (-),score=10.02 TRINITY_DN4043_c0_g1_i1:110-490(-)
MLLTLLTCFLAWKIWPRFEEGFNEVPGGTVVSENVSSSSDDQSQDTPSIVGEQSFVVTRNDSLPWMPPAEPRGFSFVSTVGVAADFCGKACRIHEVQRWAVGLKVGGDELNQVIVMLERLIEEPTL